MTKTLITGANKGLGYEAAKRLVAEGHEVWVGARNTKLGEEAAQSLNPRFVQLDVTDDASVEAAAALVAETGGLDVLVNNAGIADRTPVVDTAAADVLRVLETNVLGPVRVLRAFTPVLEASRSPVVVNVSSGVGSLTYAGDPNGPYSHSAGVSGLKSCSEHVDYSMGQRSSPLACELSRPRLHGYRSQPTQGDSDGRGGRRRDHPAGDGRVGWSNGHLLRPQRCRSLVTRSRDTGNGKPSP